MADARLGVGLFLNSSQFQAGLNQAKASLHVLKEGLGALGIGLGFEELIRQSVESGAKVQELATRFGISTETVQRLQFVASQTGTSIDTLTGAFGKLLKN